MGITDVIRGDDHLSNTPKQLLVLGAGSSGRATPICRSFTVRTERSCPSATAPPPSRSCARRVICRRRFATTSPCSAGGRGRYDHPAHVRARRPLLHRSRGQGVGHLRRAQAALAQRSLHARHAARRVRRRCRRAPRAGGHPEAAADPDRLRGLRNRPGEGADPERALAAGEVPVRAAGRRPKAWSKVMRRCRSQSGGGPRPAALGRALRRTQPRARARRAGRAARRQGEGRLPACGGDHGHDRFAGDLRFAGGARTRPRRGARRGGPRAPAGGRGSPLTRRSGLTSPVPLPIYGDPRIARSLGMRSKR